MYNISTTFKLAIAFVIFSVALIGVDGQGYPNTKRRTPVKLQVGANIPTGPAGSQGVTTMGKVPDNIQGCYTGQNYWPSVRLPNSLDNLIYIVEKIEDDLYQKNITLDAAFVANLILRRFQMNGVIDVLNSESKMVDQNENFKQDIIFRLLPNNTLQFPEMALTDKEKCSLHWMISTSINTTNLDPYNNAPVYDPSTLTDFPRENGAMYAGRYGSLSGGPLLSGIAASAVINTVKVQDMVSPDLAIAIDPSILSSQVDPVLVASLAGEIGQSVLLYSYPQNSHAVFGPDAAWNGTTCSTTFSSIEKVVTAATKAELLGAVDGMVVGNYLRTTYYRSGVKLIPSLSQTLRSYYGRGLEMNSFTACERTAQANVLINSVTPSAVGFAAVYQVRGASVTGHQFPSDASSLSNYISSAVGNFSQTYLQGQQFYCDSTVTSSICQTLNDIIVVMDTSMSSAYDNFQEQKNFIGSLIQRIGVFPNSSHVGIVTFGSNKEPVPFQPGLSGADARCQLQWAPLYGSTTDVPSTIRYVQDKFRSIRNLQKTGNYAQSPGKVVIFTYLQSNMPNVDQVKLAMSEFRREFPEVTSLAVGKNRDVLKYFVANEDKDIFYKAGEQLSYNVDPIITRLCKVPALLEYKNCRNPDSYESQYIAEDFVYQDTYQWLSVHPISMNLSEELYLHCQTQYGGARFCLSRSPDDPGASSNCQETSSQSSMITFGPLYPCKSYSDNCPSLYINVRGKSGGSSEKCAERACDSLNQVKVSISHEGMKCDGNQLTAIFSILLLCIISLSVNVFYL